MQSPPLYSATQAPDGTFTITDVPIFSAHAEEHAGGTRSFDAGWLTKAVGRAQLRQAEGYLPPLHVRHHGEGAPVEAAGKFRVTRVGTISHGGEQIPTIFADLVGVRPAVYERIRKGELSYRSVEILDVETPEIDSLALLDDEVPFFRFPLLRVAEPTAASGTFSVTNTGIPVAYSQAGRGTQVLTRYSKEGSMPELTGQAPETNPTKKMADIGQIAQLAAQLAQALQQFAQQQQQPQGQPQQGPGPSEQPAPAMAARQFQPTASFAAAKHAETISEASEAEAKVEGAQDAVAARVELLEAKLASLAEAREVDTKARELVAAGFSTEQAESFTAKAQESGLQLALAYAAGMERRGPAPSDPPTHWSGELHTQAPDPVELQAFAAKGPEALANARDFYGSWKRSQSPLPFDQYVAANIDPDQFLGVGR